MRHFRQFSTTVYQTRAEEKQHHLYQVFVMLVLLSLVISYLSSGTSTLNTRQSLVEMQSKSKSVHIIKVIEGSLDNQNCRKR